MSSSSTCTSATAAAGTHRADHGRHPTPILVLSAEPRTGNRRPRSKPSSPARWTPCPSRRVDAGTGNGVAPQRASVSRVAVLRHARGGSTRPPPAATRRPAWRPPIVAIAASTGGPSALAVLLAGLPGCPPRSWSCSTSTPTSPAGLSTGCSGSRHCRCDGRTRTRSLRSRTRLHRPGRRPPAPWRQSASRARRPARDPAPAVRRPAVPLRRAVGRRASACLDRDGRRRRRGSAAMHRSGAQPSLRTRRRAPCSACPGRRSASAPSTKLLPLDQLADAIQRAERQVRR